MGANEEFRGLPDEGNIEGGDEMGAGAAVKGVEGVSELEGVVVDFACCVVARVEREGGGLAS